MPVLELSQSLLVNQGLSLRPDLVEAADGDVVASFKHVVGATDMAITDQSLVATIEAVTSPLDLATYFINAKFGELGGAGGFLGTTTTAVAPVLATDGFVRTFQYGAIYWHPQVGAHEVHGPIRVRWQELGGERGFLGFPTTDVTPGRDVRSEGAFAHFQGGSIYWAPPSPKIRIEPAVTLETSATGLAVEAINGAGSAPEASATPASSLGHLAVATIAVSQIAPMVEAATPVPAQPAMARPVGELLATGIDSTSVGIINELVETSAGAFEVHGAIREKYLALGAEASILGYPRTDETGTPDGIGRFNHFQAGSIYWTPGTWAHEVHGLIRDRWASLGWERNPQLGYPITDELIPDPRIGHRRPEVHKKPVVGLPSDVVKLPAEAAAAGFPSAVVNLPVAAVQPPPAPAAPDRVLAGVESARLAASPLGTLSGKSIGVTSDSAESRAFSPVVTATLETGPVAALFDQAASTPGERSTNRFGDFESGVLFWNRGATSAFSLSPIAATSDGTSLSFPGADIAAKALALIGNATFQGQNMQLASVSFVGVTNYVYDGIQVHNRRHRLQFIFQGIEEAGLGVGILGNVGAQAPVTAAIELQVEVWFDAAQRRIALTPTDWTLTQASTGSYAALVTSALQAKLDPVLWTSYELITLPDTDAGRPIAVLSVKTLPNGAVAVFVEPHINLPLVTEVANAVAPSVVFSATDGGR